MGETKLVVKVINRRTAKSHELSRAIYVGRPTELGNPFSVEQHGRDECIRLYKQWLNLQYSTGNQVVIDYLKGLVKLLKERGELTLSCWCAPEPCHADLIGQAIVKLAEVDK